MEYRVQPRLTSGHRIDVFPVCVTRDASVYDSLGAASVCVCVRVWGGGGTDMVTIHGALTCECHVKAHKAVVGL